MKRIITLILAGAIGLFFGYLYFGSGYHIALKGVSSGVEAVQEKAKTMISSGQPDAPGPPPQPSLKKEEPIASPSQLEKGESKVTPPQQKAAPTLPEKAEETPVELSDKREPSPNQENKSTQEKPDWNAKDIDIIFKILNGAQDRLQGKSVAAPQEENSGVGGTEKAPVRQAPINGTPLQGKSVVAPQEAHPGTGGTDHALLRQARSVPLKRKETSQTPKGIKGRVSYYARKLGMKESLALAMCHVESGFNPKAVSHKGAMGLMQVMPGTANIYGVQKKDLLDPDINIRTGLAYFRDMRSYFQNEEMALAAYNCGPARVMENKIPLETRIYIRDVKNMERYYARFFI